MLIKLKLLILLTMKDELKLKSNHHRLISFPIKVIKNIKKTTDENSVTHYENVIYSLL